MQNQGVNDKKTSTTILGSKKDRNYDTCESLFQTRLLVWELPSPLLASTDDNVNLFNRGKKWQLVSWQSITNMGCEPGICSVMAAGSLEKDKISGTDLLPKCRYAEGAPKSKPFNFFIILRRGKSYCLKLPAKSICLNLSFPASVRMTELLGQELLNCRLQASRRAGQQYPLLPGDTWKGS